MPFAYIVTKKTSHCNTYIAFIVYFYVNMIIMKFSRKTIGLLISIVEWYDFAIYAMFIKEISKSFFSNYSGQYAGWYSFSVLSIAYLFRPIGAYAFGRMTEKTNENTSLQVSLFIMAISSLLVCIVPENSLIGIAILILVRILQGLAMGGCYGTSYVYVVSNVSEKKNYAASFVCIGFIIGFILGQMMNVMLTIYASNTLFAKYGWRLAFMLGALMSLLVIQLIGYKKTDAQEDVSIASDVVVDINDSEDIVESTETHFDGYLYDDNPYMKMMSDVTDVKNNTKISEVIEESVREKTFTWANLIHFFGSVMVGGLDILGFYLIFIYNTYLVQNILNLSVVNIELYNMGLLLCLWPMIVIFSKLSDNYGERKILMLSSLLLLIMSYMLPWNSLYTLVPMLIMLGACYGSLPVWMVERFSAKPAYVGLSFNVAAALFNVLLSFLAPLSMQYGIGIFKIVMMLIAMLIFVIIYIDDRS